MKDTYDTATVIQVLGFVVFLILILFIHKYYIDNSKPIIVPSSNNQKQQVYQEPQDIKVRCPPEELMKEKPLCHKNDINVVNKPQINTFKEGDKIDTYGFENELLKTQNQTFSSELEEMYQTSLDKYDISVNTSCMVKPNKSDLPIANIPMFILNEGKPLRLSEKPL